MSINLASTKVGIIVAWGTELGILTGLFWKYFDVGHNILFYGGNAAIYPGCLVFVCGAVATFLLVGDRTQVRLWLLTGPCVVMAAFLVLMLSWQTESSLSKEISKAAVERHVPQTFYHQWLVDHLIAMQSERLTCVIIAASLCLLYAYSLSSIRQRLK